MNPFEASKPTLSEAATPDAGALAIPESEFHLSDLLEKLKRHWKLIALVVALCLGASGVLYFMTPKQYQATARVQIERRSLAPVSSGQNPWLDSFLNMEFYPTQIQLLQSRGLAERVVVDMGLASDPSFNPGGAALTRPSDDPADPEAADAAVLGRLAARLRSGLQVQAVSNTQLVDLTYRAASPEFAARAANAFAQAFIDWGISTRTQTAGRASTFLVAQVDALKDEIQEKDARLQAYSRQADIVSLDPASNVVIQRLQALNSDFIQAKATRIDKEARYREIQGAPRQSVADEHSSGTVNQLMQEQLKLEGRYQTQLQTYKPEWPGMVELKAEIDEGRRNLNRTIAEQAANARNAAQAEYQTALRREAALTLELEQAKSELLDQSSAGVELTNLQVEIATSRDLLEKLLLQQSETDVAARLQTTRETNIRVVDRALVPGGPFRPSLRENLVMGLGLGLLLGIGAAFLIEYMDRTVKTPEEIERRLRLPNLAVIPDVGGSGRKGRGYGYGYGVRKRKASRGGPPNLIERQDPSRGPDQIELLPHERPRLSVSEAYRSLRTALLLSSARDLEVVAVTSAGPGEGKTATSTNLAVVMAQLGRRVLLIDGDLRKPRLHEVFGVSNRVGLVNVLAGGEDPSKATFPAGVANLHVVPSGPIPPNPSELLASARMREFLGRARSLFDFVIIDTPPVLAVTDATIIGSQTDGVVLCLRAGKVLREDALSCRDQLLLNDVKILGTVLNRHRDASGPGGKYYYYEAYVAEADAGSEATPAA
ncbi:MAG TPA: polysaccharide biosynthesis tyrosine autokinase [Thermoanaerobaculia bacterium]|nr:polysaccharide biosynthesis tyrosine autokinase [Thermoanaerobaculia bacterium]